MRVVLTGASGELGAYVSEALRAAAHDVVAWSGHEVGRRAGFALVPVDLADAAATARALADADPEVIVHAAAVSRADAVRLDPARAWAINVEATARLADWCAQHGRRLIFTSTDLVFDGTKAWNREEDLAEPVLAYGQTKREAERAVLAIPRGLVTRVSLLFGASRAERDSYYDRTFAALGRGEPRTFFEDEFRTPLDLATAAMILVRLTGADVTGLLHVAGRERVSRFDLIRRIAIALGIDPSLVRANRQTDVALAEPRPADVSLDTSRLAALWPDLSRPAIEEAALSSRSGA